MITKELKTKDQKEFDKIKSRIAEIDMERAILLKRLRENSEFAMALIKERILLMIGTFYSTPNINLIYCVNGGDVTITTKKKPTRLSYSATGYKKDDVIKEYTVTLNITKYETTGEALKTTYKIVSEELPKDVDKWLCMGNSVITKGQAKDYLTKSLNAEKKALEARIKQINETLK